MKITHPRIPMVRPDTPCPDCSSILITSEGDNWKCKTCGRKFRKILRGIRQFVSYDDIPTRVEKVKEI